MSAFEEFNNLTMDDVANHLQLEKAVREQIKITSLPPTPNPLQTC